MILDSYYTTSSAATFLGITPTTIRMLTSDGKLHPVRIGNANLYQRDDLTACKSRWYNDGYSAKDIGEKYGVGKSMVHYHLTRLKVDGVGVDGRRKGRPTVYEPSTIDKIAKIIGWETVDGWADPPALIRCPSCNAETVKGDVEYLESMVCPKCNQTFRASF